MLVSGEGADSAGFPAEEVDSAAASAVVAEASEAAEPPGVGEMKMFSDDDLRKIREAVQTAERRTRGEIVPMVVPSSARYSEARYLAGLALSLLALTILLTWELGWGQHLWHLHYPAWIVLGVVLAYALG